MNEMNMILKMLRNTRSREIEIDGEMVEQIAGDLITNGETVYLMKTSAGLHVAIGDVPAHGSPPVSYADAVALIKRAAR